MKNILIWWKNQKYWQRGGILGFLIFLILYLEWIYGTDLFPLRLLDYLLFDISRHLVIPAYSPFYSLYSHLPISLLEMLLRYLFYPVVGIILGIILDTIKKTNKKPSKLYLWWRSLRYWQKGGIIATTFYYLPLILVLINFIFLEEYEPMLDFFTITGFVYWLFMILDKFDSNPVIYGLLLLFYLFLLYPLLGILIGLLIGIIKRKRTRKRK